MRQKKLAIWDRDSDYCQALAFAIASRYREYAVSVLMAERDLQAGAWDVLLVGEEADWGQEGSAEIGGCPGTTGKREGAVVIVLTEQEGAGISEALLAEREAKPQPQLYKYERVAELVKGIRFWYRYFTGEQTLLTGHKRLAPLWAVTAASDRALRETAAQVAIELGALEHRVLLLDFAEFDSGQRVERVMVEAGKSAEQAAETEKQAGLEEYLYFLLAAEKKSVYQQLELFLVDSGGGYFYFPLRSSRNPLLSLSQAELKRFLESVLTADFDYVVANLGSGTFAHTALLLEGCTQLLLPEEASATERMQNQNMLAYIMQTQLADGHNLGARLTVLGTQADHSVLGRWEDQNCQNADGKANRPSLDGNLEVSTTFTEEERRKEVRAYVHRIAEPAPQCTTAYRERDHGGDSQHHQQQRWSLKR